MPINLPQDQLSGVGSAYNNTLQGQFDNQNLQSQDLSNQTSQAALPGIQGQSMSLQAKGQSDQANLPGAISQAKSDVMAKMSDNDAKMMTNMGGQLAQFGSMLENIPAPARAAAVTQFASRFNLPPDSPLLKGVLSSPPDKLPDVIKSMGTNMVQLSSDYTKQSGLVGQKVQGQVTVAQTRADAMRDSSNIRSMAQIDIAKLNTASKEKLAEFSANVKQQLQDTKAKTTDQLVAARTQQYQANPSPENQLALSQATQIKQAITQVPALAAAFQNASTGENILGSGMAPNTVPAPVQNPAASFPVSNLPPGSAPQPATSPAPAEPGNPQAAPQSQTITVTMKNGKPSVGTQNGKDVFTSDPAHPSDKTKWHY